MSEHTRSCILRPFFLLNIEESSSYISRPMASNETCRLENSPTRANVSDRMAVFVHVRSSPTNRLARERTPLCVSSDVYTVSTWYPTSIPEIFAELSNEITRHIKQAQEVSRSIDFVATSPPILFVSFQSSVFYGMTKIPRKTICSQRCISSVTFVCSLLKAYIHEWSKFYEQCEYLPKPFVRMETTAGTNNNAGTPGSPPSTPRTTDHVRQLMLESWNNNIFKDIKHRLQVRSEMQRDTRCIAVRFSLPEQCYEISASRTKWRIVRFSIGHWCTRFIR